MNKLKEGGWIRSKVSILQGTSKINVGNTYQIKRIVKRKDLEGFIKVKFVGQRTFINLHESLLTPIDDLGAIIEEMYREIGLFKESD